ncbi:MAG: branched-chain amino acid ABC transporter permease [Ignavibacteriales bacterium]
MVFQQIINGLTLGTTYSLLALGYSMVFGVLSFINFAHGDIAMVGGYVAWYSFTVLHQGFLISCVFAVAVSVVLGIAIEKVGYGPIRRAPRLAMVIASLGFSFILATAVQIVWGTEPQQMPSIGAVTSYTVFGGTFNSVQIWVLSLSVALMFLLQLLIQKTRIGMALRATALDRDTAGLMGININNVISFTFGLGSGLAAVSAIMMAVYYGALYPSMGGVIGMKGFTAVVLGGAGSIPGAMAGGVLMGLIESLAGTLLPSAVRDAIAFLVLIIVLLGKPSGLLGKEMVKE